MARTRSSVKTHQASYYSGHRPSNDRRAPILTFPRSTTAITSLFSASTNPRGTESMASRGADGMRFDCVIASPLRPRGSTDRNPSRRRILQRQNPRQASGRRARCHRAIRTAYGKAAYGEWGIGNRGNWVLGELKSRFESLRSPIINHYHYFVRFGSGRYLR